MLAKVFNEKFDNYELQKDYAISNGGFYKASIHKVENDTYCVGAKGAPEAIFELCKLSKDTKDDLLDKVKEMSERGLRILASCKAVSHLNEPPHDIGNFDYTFLGLIGFSDPVREGISQAVQECYTAGMRVIMITGDYSGTAVSVAKRIGLKNYDNYLTGADIEAMKLEELKEKIKDVNVFARIQPTQKLSIVNVLKGRWC